MLELYSPRSPYWLYVHFASEPTLDICLLTPVKSMSIETTARVVGGSFCSLFLRDHITFIYTPATLRATYVAIGRI